MMTYEEKEKIEAKFEKLTTALQETQAKVESLEKRVSDLEVAKAASEIPDLKKTSFGWTLVPSFMRR